MGTCTMYIETDIDVEIMYKYMYVWMYQYDDDTMYGIVNCGWGRTRDGML